jgi:flavin reductase (DIM6/NTAB) family NADH-FMN oxidoreductase RutF/DNA-binding IclR family transcriptional regulator
MTPGAGDSFSPRDFRTVLGHFPTGVTIITSSHDGVPVGMAVGSFTSVSLEPPLVAFLPAKSSTTFPKIREAGRFCVNVLSADQESICRSFARSGGPKFEGTSYSPSAGGCPIIDGVVAWIDCEIESVTEAGDHFICVGRVNALAAAGASTPLIFFQGGYGRFEPPSLVAPAEDDLVAQLLLTDLARPEMERLAGALATECIASALVGDSTVQMAVAGTPASGLSATRVGERLPFVPPVGAVFAAWASERNRDAWLNRVPGMSPEQREHYRNALAEVRRRGFAYGKYTPARRELDLARAALHVDAPTDAERAKVRAAVDRLAETYDPDELAGLRGVEYIAAPVFDSSGRVGLQLTVYGLLPTDTHAVTYHVSELLDACARISEALGSHHAEAGEERPASVRSPEP